MKHSRAQEASITRKLATPAPEHQHTPDREPGPDRTNQEDQQAVREIGNFIEEIRQRQLDREQRQIEQVREADRDPERDKGQPRESARDPYIEQAIQEERDRQQAWEQGTHPNRDMGFEIE